MIAKRGMCQLNYTSCHCRMMSESSPGVLHSRPWHLCSFVSCGLSWMLNFFKRVDNHFHPHRFRTVNINELNTWKFKLASFVIPPSNESIADIVSREMFTKNIFFRCRESRANNFHSPVKKWWGRRSSFILRINENWSFSAFLLKASKARENWNKYLPVRKIPGIRFAMPQNRWKMLRNISPAFSLHSTFSITLFFILLELLCARRARRVRETLCAFLTDINQSIKINDSVSSFIRRPRYCW